MPEMESLIPDEIETGSDSSEPISGQVKNSTDADQFDLETLDDDQCIGLSSIFGTAYSAFIDKLTGKSGQSPDITGLPPKLQAKFKKIIAAIEKNAQIQHAKMKLENLDALAILGQAFPAGIRELSDQEKKQVTLQEISPGFYAIFIPSRLYRRLYKNSTASQAVAFSSMSESIISFIILQNEYQNKNEINMAHETHHIAWTFCKRENIPQSDEKDPIIRKAFLNFQDELIASACSNDLIHGHLISMKSLPPQVAAENEKQIEYCMAMMVKINNLLDIYETDNLNELIKLTDRQPKEMLLPIILAGSFEELFRNLERYISILKNKLPKTQPGSENYKEGLDGWSTTG